ncbi:HEPN domain-containing protein [Caloramator sp. Dgby_cultured_2]|uniref:HEPN domain-containing protein n=1 Tax=Caloramator sp. Dgby_cultured_2 TaxID=3029174 RepID=UPI00237D60CC|nr:HEPN domain-containing protein [Caloramator sp. Dgby_cultured_2]WDU82137.1 HEPN domain-containing protein [Caloramator sp. Dgby_cultured_2]
MNSKDIANEWFEFAEMDLNSAKFLLNMHPKPLEIICYHCQQSAEKYLKGYLALIGEKITKTHDLIFLNKICKKHDEEFKNIDDDCVELVDYGVNIRYPFLLIYRNMMLN